MQRAPFEGIASLRVKGERVAFWLTLLFAFPIAGALGFFLHESIGLEQVSLFIIVAMIYVTLARGRLLGSSVMIHESQYPRVFAIVKRACATLDIPMPLIFVREDYQIPAAALGFGEPYALVLSSQWIEAFQDDELAFVIGRQLGHIANGHVRYNSLLSVNGRENPVVAMMFGAWLRRCELTCDKVGLLCCGSLDAAMRAIAVETFHHFGRRIDLAQFAEQYREVQRDPVLRWGQWLSGEPYATIRIEAMRNFMLSPQYQAADAWFSREVSEHRPVAAPAGKEVLPSDCAGWWRRLAAVAIDILIVGFAYQALASASTDALHERGAAVASQPMVIDVNDVAGSGDEAPSSVRVRPHVTVHISPSPEPAVTASHAPVRIRLPWKNIDLSGMEGANGDIMLDPRAVLAIAFLSLGPLWFILYCTLLVALAGQTFGMMITGLRVVTIDYRRPSAAHAIWRYLVVALLGWLSVLLSPISRRVMLHDRISGTRLIRAERALQRTAQGAAS